MPEVYVVRKHDVDVFIVLAGKHGINAVDFPGEHGHAFVFGGRTIQRDKPKAEEVGSLHQFGQNHLAIECREGGVVDVGSIIVLEAHEPGVFDTVALRRRPVGGIHHRSGSTRTGRLRYRCVATAWLGKEPVQTAAAGAETEPHGWTGPKPTSLGSRSGPTRATDSFPLRDWRAILPIQTTLQTCPSPGV